MRCEEEGSQLRMPKWRGWSLFRQSIIFPSKCLLLKLTSHLKHKARGREDSLVVLSKEVESFRGYEDIQVMWEMVHCSWSTTTSAHQTRENFKPSFCRFCFKPESSLYVA